MVDYNSSTLGFTGQDTRHGLVGYSPGTLDNRCARYSIIPWYGQKQVIWSYHGKVLKVFFRICKRPKMYYPIQYGKRMALWRHLATAYNVIGSEETKVHLYVISLNNLFWKKLPVQFLKNSRRTILLKITHLRRQNYCVHEKIVGEGKNGTNWNLNRHKAVFYPPKQWLILIIT